MNKQLIHPYYLDIDYEDRIQINVPQCKLFWERSFYLSQTVIFIKAFTFETFLNHRHWKEIGGLFFPN